MTQSGFTPCRAHSDDILDAFETQDYTSGRKEAWMMKLQGTEVASIPPAHFQPSRRWGLCPLADVTGHRSQGWISGDPVNSPVTYHNRVSLEDRNFNCPLFTASLSSKGKHFPTNGSSPACLKAVSSKGGASSPLEGLDIDRTAHYRKK